MFGDDVEFGPVRAGQAMPGSFVTLVAEAGDAREQTQGAVGLERVNVDRIVPASCKRLISVRPSGRG